MSIPSLREILFRCFGLSHRKIQRMGILKVLIQDIAISIILLGPLFYTKLVFFNKN